MGNPQTLKSGTVVVSREDSLRLDAFVMRVGLKRAPRLLGVGESTVRSGMDQGRMLASTRARLYAALDRALAEAS